MTRAMIPGDHLQLMYHFWLLSDFIGGGTPWFHNLYEFNRGDDAERFRVNPYFVPASLFFAIGHRLHGEALGWNLAFVLSLWLGFWAAWRLARRFVSHEALALAAALPALALPYRWAALCDGSPTGFAMFWAPVLFLAATAWARRPTGLAAGAVAGAWIGCSLGDTQNFFLYTLALPLWIALLWLARRGGESWRTILRPAARTALLVAAGAAVASALTVLRLSTLKDSVMKQGRALAEVAIFSPLAEGYLATRYTGISNDLFVGWATPAAMLLVLAGSLWALRRGAPVAGRWSAVAALGLLAGLLAIAVLALGTNGPGEGRLFDLTRKLVPKFSSIRQPLKLLSLAPALLPVLFAVALTLLRASPRAVRFAPAAAAIIALSLLGQYKGKIAPTFCTLDRENAAYAAVAEDCDRDGRKRQVLSLPLWPGESAWSSLYQHYHALYRLRGLNGYSPLVSWRYFTDIFLPLRELNQGVLSEASLALLEQVGVRHLVLHENAFPDKVSPWPVEVTLARLRAHPRLAPLAQDGEMHAFRILATPRAEAPAEALPRFWLPTRHFGAEAGWAREFYGELATDPSAGGGRCVTLAPGSRPLVYRPYHLTPAPQMAWRLRVKGAGVLLVREKTGGAQRYPPHSATPEAWEGATEHPPVRLEIQADDWSWLPVPSALATAGLGGLEIEAAEGVCHLDEILLTAGEDLALAPGESVEIPAAAFFHAGYSTPDGAVVFRQGRDPLDVVLYGPALPLAPGTYGVEALTDAASGARLEHGRAAGWPRLLFTVADNRPTQWNLRFLDEQDVVVRGFRISRKE
jgi:hypothetical protein